VVINYNFTSDFTFSIELMKRWEDFHHEDYIKAWAHIKAGIMR
jgi:hypothetical protein